MVFVIENADSRDRSVGFVKIDDFGKAVKPGAVSAGGCKKVQRQPPGIGYSAGSCLYCTDISLAF